MNTNSEGTQFTVESDFGMNTPEEAVFQCKERAEKAVNTIKESQ